MLPARHAMLADALAEMEGDVALWVEGNDEALDPPDLVVLQELQPRLKVRRRSASLDPWLPTERYPLYRLGPVDQPDVARAGFVGFPEGFMLDALCDLAVAISRGDSLASPLARETLAALDRDVELRILTSPG